MKQTLDRARLRQLAEESESWPPHMKGELGADAPSRIDMKGTSMKLYQLVYIPNETILRDLGTIGCKLVAARIDFKVVTTMEGGAWINVHCVNDNDFEGTKRIAGI